MNDTRRQLMRVTKGGLVPDRPFLSDILHVIVPFPMDAVVLGMALDGLPVLWNVYMNKNSNIIVWDKKARQSLAILKVISEYIFSHQKKNVEFVVFTNHPNDYGKLNDYGMGTNSKTPCIGIIPFFSSLSDVVVRGLSRWIHENHTSSKHPVVILIDGLENINTSSEEFRDHFRRILDLGRNKNVYVLGTASKNNLNKIHEWLDGFQCEMYGMDIPDEFEYVEGTETVIFYTPRTELL